VDATWTIGLFLAVALAVYLPVRLAVLPGSKAALDRLGVDPAIELPFLKVFHAAAALLAAVIAVAASGVGDYFQATEAIVAGITIAVGFASQDVLGNLVSGAFIVLDPEFNIGDDIRWDGREGVIEDISFRVTRIHTYDNQLISVPNSELTSRAVANPTAKDRRRLEGTFGIGYADDIDHAREVMVAAAADVEGILDRPAPAVRVAELADSYVGLEARYWVASPARADLVRIESAYAQAVKERFDAEGIEMPYPYRQLTGSVDTRPGPTGDGHGATDRRRSGVSEGSPEDPGPD
jgi:small-conductance mechanosensitive channel